LAPVKKVARMLKKYLEGLLGYFRHWITNAATEGLNSKIQAIKAAARGFRNFDHYRIRILFFCGRLVMRPKTTHLKP
jgi:transposase